MARILQWPLDLGITSLEDLGNPASYGAAESEAISGFIQTTYKPTRLRAWALSIHDLNGSRERAFRGWLKGMQGGGNAVALSLPDGAVQGQYTPVWESGHVWARGHRWGAAAGTVPVAAAAAKGATQISLTNQFWGHSAEVGVELGFSGHWGAYTVTEVLAAGIYRIEPPLRNAIATNQIARQKPPVLATIMPDTGNYGRGITTASGLMVRLREVRDDYARTEGVFDNA